MNRIVLVLGVVATIFLGSCAASIDLTVNPDRSGLLSVRADIPGAAAARLQSFRAVGGDSQADVPFFDIPAIRNEVASRGIEPLVTEGPSPNSFRGTFSLRNLEDAAADPELAGRDLLKLERIGDETTFSFSLSRKNAEALPALFPGLDPYVLEALAPPALDPYPVTMAEYREMLTALLGDAAMKEFDSAATKILIRTPGPITKASGGIVSGKTFLVELKLLDLLVLENPITFSLSWK